MKLYYMMLWRTISSAWRYSKVIVEHCGPLFLSVSEAGVCEKVDFVEISVGHAR